MIVIVMIVMIVVDIESAASTNTSVSKENNYYDRRHCDKIGLEDINETVSKNTERLSKTNLDKIIPRRPFPAGHKEEQDQPKHHQLIRQPALRNHATRKCRVAIRHRKV